ncbi:hypothetical protein [Nitrosomonas sp. HPC101]|uniref:hypothetical protein n=1 Tax=Nitrosomonas sp. HPC101 TaxID=1658667 RepID=UPI00136D294C|nr:hypothetical protein [Nitrosomonas sp. HPC101]
MGSLIIPPLAERLHSRQVIAPCLLYFIKPSPDFAWHQAQFIANTAGVKQSRSCGVKTADFPDHPTGDNFGNHIVVLYYRHKNSFDSNRL